MNPVWLVPVLAAIVGGAAVAALLRQAAGSARELADELARFGEARPAVARLRADATQARAALIAIRRR